MSSPRVLNLLPATSEGRLEAEVNVLLRLQPDDERGDVDHLFPHSDVSLTDENSSVMNGLGQAELEDLKSKEDLFSSRRPSHQPRPLNVHLGLQSPL